MNMDIKDLILAIDNGTQSLKALLFDLEGRLLFKERVPFKPYFSEHPGWAEQDPLLFWQALCDACNGLWQQGGVDKERIAGVVLTTQRGTVVNVDWLDQRKTYGLPPVGGIWGILFRLIGVSNTVAYLQTEAEINWIRKNQPEIWRKTHKFLLLSGYLTYCLTGEFVDSVGCQVGYVPFDYRRLRWSSGWDWKWRAVPVNPDQLPKLLPPGEVLGQITQNAADKTGIPVGLPLIAAAADKAAGSGW